MRYRWVDVRTPSERKKADTNIITTTFLIVILLYWIIEHIFYFVKMRKNHFFELSEAANGLRSRTCPAGCGAGAGVDSVWEQEKLEATKTA